MLAELTLDSDVHERAAVPIPIEAVESLCNFYFDVQPPPFSPLCLGKSMHATLGDDGYDLWACLMVTFDDFEPYDTLPATWDELAREPLCAWVDRTLIDEMNRVRWHGWRPPSEIQAAFDRLAAEEIATKETEETEWQVEGDREHAQWLASGEPDVLEVLTEKYAAKRRAERKAELDACNALALATSRVRCRADSTDEEIAAAEAAEEAAFAAWDQKYGYVRKGTAMSSVRSAADLQGKHFAPVHYVVPGFIGEGCTIFAGRPKVGKSWLGLDVGLAVAGGTEVLGQKAEQGDVLALMLEDNERRLKSRISKILGPFAQFPRRFSYATEWPRVDEGGLDKIREWIASVPKPRLIIVDVLARVRSQRQGRQAQYEADYQAIAGLQAIASEHRIALVVIHHLRKSASDSGDAIDKISGTLGLSGAADSVLVIDRDHAGVTLYGRGRDIEEIETAVEFNPVRCRWRVLGTASDVRKSDERKAIISTLRDAGASMSPADIAAAVGMPAGNVRRLLFKMVRAGELSKTGGGYFLNTGNTGHAVTPSQQIIPPTPPY